MYRQRSASERETLAAFLGPLLTGIAAGCVLFTATVLILSEWPTVLRERGSDAGVWAIGPTLAVAAAAGAVVVGRGRHRHRRLPRLTVALVLLGGGGAWVVLGLVEQHMFRSFDIARGSGLAVLWDTLFHAVGVMVAAIGVSMLGRIHSSALTQQAPARSSR